MSPKGLTIRDVARAAGVSTATVSRALRGFSNVDPATRDRIEAIAREMRFSVSPTASRLASGRTGTIGIVTPFVGRWYFTEIFAGLEEGLKPFDVDLLLHSTEPHEVGDPPGAHLRMRRRVDGALIIGLAEDSDEVQAMAALGIPIVLIGARGRELPCVCIDDRIAARAAVEHLTGLGHERVGLITGRRLPTRILPENDRLDGYVEVLAERRLTVDKTLYKVGHFTSLGGQQAMTELLEQPRRPTAVFCMSDEMAYGALRAMRLSGVGVGADRSAGEIAVIGFDDHDLAEVFDLSTIRQPVREIGLAAAGLLMGMLSDAPSRDHLVMPTTLLVRGTTQP